MTFTFEVTDPACRLVGETSLTVGPVDCGCEVPPSLVPHAEEVVFDSLDYVLPDGEDRIAKNVYPIHNRAEVSVLSQAWYRVSGNFSRAELTVIGEVNLILCDGASLTVNGGIRVVAGNKLNVFCQEGGTGRLVAIGADNCAGIGGGYSDAGGTVTINGGTVTATGGSYGAGIGGGDHGAGCEVTINGGKVTATGGGRNGAGIGGGRDGADGMVMFGVDFAGSILADGGVMTQEEYAKDHGARSVTMPVSLVSIPQVNGLVCTVSNGLEEVTGYAKGGMKTYIAAAGDTLKVYFTLKAGCAYVKEPTSNPMEVPVSDWFVTVDAASLPQVSMPEIKYLDWNGEGLFETNVTDYTFVMPEMSVLEAGRTYVVADEVARNGEIVVNGTPDKPTCLILCDGAKLTVTSTAGGQASIQVSSAGAETNSLVICGQAAGTGVLAVINLADGGAGIGGGNYGSCGMVTINGGMVTATGGSGGLCGAGIGGGYYGDGGMVTINGGTVTATGGSGDLGGGGAGIGGGWSGAGGTVTINGISPERSESPSGDGYQGCTVTATGGKNGAGIGGGFNGAGGEVTINGGTVTATGNDGGAGIGGGHGGAGGDITISGGTVTASGGTHGAGIGGGQKGDGGDVTINGGEVTATGGEKGAGIGGGHGGAGGEVAISGGEVTATGGYRGAGIGGGIFASGGTVTISGGTVTAQGGEWGAGIGGGHEGAGGTVTINGGTVTATGNDGGAGIGGGNNGAGGEVTLDETKVEVVEGAYGNGSEYVKIAEKAPMVVPVTPGELVVFDTAAEATNAMGRAELKPSDRVAAVFGENADAKGAYCAKFGFEVVPTSDGKWAVAALLNPPDWTNVVESAHAATRQIPVADIAALEPGVPTNVTVEGGVPGFYYTIYGGSTVTNIRAFVSETSRNVLCEPNKPVEFSGVVKPSDAAGFFTIGVLEVPTFYIAGEDSSPTGIPPYLPGHPPVRH